VIHRLILGAAALASVAATKPVSASQLFGETLEISYVTLTPSFVASVESTDNLVGTTGASLFALATWAPLIAVTPSQNQIRFSFTDFPVDLEPLGWWFARSLFVTFPFNGFQVRDRDNRINDFTNVTINPLTNVAALDTGRIGFDSENIYVNFERLTFHSDSVVLLDVTTAPDPMTGGVPEPASWAMLIAGFGLTGAAMRRRRMVPA
jgi:hypothetical protein